MRTDIYGQQIYSESEVCHLVLRKPNVMPQGILVEREITFDPFLDIQNQPITITYTQPSLSLEEFDRQLQSRWHMPSKYKTLDVVEHVVALCNTDEQIQRVAQELLLYMERDLFDLLRYLIYLVDTMREHNIVWGVGRGSSVCSYVLYLIGVHRIDSMYYDLDITDFLK